MLLVNAEKGEVLADEVDIVDSLIGKLRGLILRSEFDDGEALMFRFSEPRKVCAHTFFVLFSIDLLFLNRKLEVVDMEKDLPPWKFYFSDSAAYRMIELPAGTLSASDTELEDEIDIISR